MKKNSLFMFLDYLLVLLFWIFGVLIFSWMLELSWGSVAYSIINSSVFFALIYSRAWKTAKAELKNKERQPKLLDGFLVCLPFLIFNLVIIIGFALIFYNVIPIRDNVVDIIYSFAQNEPRVRHEILLIDNLSDIVRIWFAPLGGFIALAEKHMPIVMLLAPIIIVSASLLGYFLGMKKYYLSEKIANISEKVKEKFNE